MKTTDAKQHSSPRVTTYYTPSLTVESQPIIPLLAFLKSSNRHIPASSSTAELCIISLLLLLKSSKLAYICQQSHHQVTYYTPAGLAEVV
ncbi:hypothetical protein C8F04DRAFT_1261219 [Mycena alexandri]|uniref:Uncharacterized protein n=1 Tax=Mycena alexandri TaxID=1745969 RepID=A0AAD6SS88_9AGAR|nr:hypothetical protein C8F04DRAFT_1261219 [Mycena alexandri]